MALAEGKVESILSKIEQAIINDVDTVSLVTIIETYVEEVITLRPVQLRLEFIGGLHKLLEVNTATIESIGWDLPKIVIKFLSEADLHDEDSDTEGSTNTAGSNSTLDSSLQLLTEHILSLFDLIVKYGNAKETFIGITEVITLLTIGNYEDEKDIEEVLNKLHVTSWLLVHVLNSIKVDNPSRFLSTAIVSLKKYIKSIIDLIEDPNKLLEIIFTFCDEYDIFFLSENSDEDEGVLLKKLIVTLVDFIIEIIFSKHTFNFGSFNYSADRSIIDPTTLKLLQKFLVLLEEKLDLNISELYDSYLVSTRKIYEPVTSVTKLVQNENINQYIYQLPYTYMMKQLNDVRHLEILPNGVTIITSIYFLFDNNNPVNTTKKKQILKTKNIDVQDLIMGYLRNFTPSFFSETFASRGAESLALYWIKQYIDTHPKDILIKEFKDCKTTLLNIFLQLLLLKLINEHDDNMRLKLMQLTQQILILINENIVFDFIIDTLLTCPFIQGKIFILSTLKDLMSKPINNATVLVNTSSPVPTLPPRAFITINDDRMASIHSLAQMSIENASLLERERADLILLQEYINLYVTMSHKWNFNLLCIFHNEVKEKILAGGNQFGTETDEDIQSIPEISFIKLSLETLEEHIKKLESVEGSTPPN